MFEVASINNMNIMQSSLDALWTRQQVISNNLANIDTPNYKSKEVVFEEYLQKELQSGVNANDSELDDTVYARIVENDDTTIREDGNNVDIDKENIELYRAQIQYDYMVRQVTSTFSNLRSVLTETR